MLAHAQFTARFWTHPFQDCVRDEPLSLTMTRSDRVLTRAEGDKEKGKEV